MGKIIRSAYPLDFSIGLLLLIFGMACLLSHQIFDVPVHEIHDSEGLYFGMFLASLAVIIMVIIVWEEILFPLKIKEIPGGIVFRNHHTKLIVQLFIYCSIPAILGFIYFEYEVNHFRFFMWSAVCMLPPIIEKIISGVNNYNDYLKLTQDTIEYKNNEKEGTFAVSHIQKIIIIRDDRNFLHKIEIVPEKESSVIIDLDEMELDDFYTFIDQFLTSKYKHLLH